MCKAGALCGVCMSISCAFIWFATGLELAVYGARSVQKKPNQGMKQERARNLVSAPVGQILCPPCVR